MYVISDILDLGNAHERILADMKDISAIDDSQPNTLSPEDLFDE
jgi:hypothetical protein